MSVGRSPDDSRPSYTIANNPGLSEKHFLITSKDGNFFVTDCKSKNGTFLNGSPLQTDVPCKLAVYDIIRASDEFFIFQIKPEKTGFKSGAYYVKDLLIPEKFGEYPVVAIGPSAFSGIDGIETISLPAGVHTLGDSAFRIRTLRKLDLGAGLKTIGLNCFADCFELAEIILPEGLRNISSEAFRNCTSLVSLSLPDSVTFIGPAAFSGCTALSSISLPQKLNTIQEDLFANCSALTEITIPASVRQIENAAFSGCSQLTQVKIHNGARAIIGHVLWPATSWKKSGCLV